MPKKSEKPKIPSARARAFVAWMKANETNTKQVSDKAEVNYQTLASFVQGDTQQLLGGREEKIAMAYDVEASEIFGGRKVTRKGRVARTIPVFSWVAAGQVREPEFQAEPTETIEISGLPAGDYFATRVQGDSMDRLSPSGSLIIVNKAETELRRGRRYVFNLRGQTTYKRWEADPDRLVPESTNPSNEPIFPKSDRDWSVIGRVRLTLMDDL